MSFESNPILSVTLPLSLVDNTNPGLPPPLSLGAFDLLDIEHLTPVEVADGGNHEKDSAVSTTTAEGEEEGKGEGVKGQRGSEGVSVGPMDCSGR